MMESRGDNSDETCVDLIVCRDIFSPNSALWMSDRAEVCCGIQGNGANTRDWLEATVFHTVPKHIYIQMIFPPQSDFTDVSFVMPKFHH